MINRSYTWIDESIEHSEEDTARAVVLARKWSALQTAEEERRFRRTFDIDNGYDYGDRFETQEEQEEHERHMREQQAERDLEIELVEDKLERLGARMMRPYEHWNEEEGMMQYLESRYDY